MQCGFESCLESLNHHTILYTTYKIALNSVLRSPQNFLCNSDAYLPYLTKCPLTHCAVQRADGSLEDAVTSFDKKRPFCAAFEASGEDPAEEEIGDDFTQQVEKKRRLTFDQVRSLEYNFEIENKLEPERKMQLAKELGLQPRQVAVWFQNRRARWKTKQLERDYEVLNLDYNRLKKEFDAVIQEKQELQDAVRL